MENIRHPNKSILCPNVSQNNRGRSTRSTGSSDGSSGRYSLPAQKSSATEKRLSFSAAHKLAHSLPSSGLLSSGSSTHLFQQYSLEDVAMQNNCTVISNKVGPVVIKNCKEEFQMRQNERNIIGRLHEQSTEHELLLDKFFLLKDHFIGVDRHDTLEEHGVPNLRVVESTPTIYAIGQPTMNGLAKFTNLLLKKHKCIYYINVRVVPTLFLRRSGDFLPYSAYSGQNRNYSKIYESEQELHDAEREIQMQALRIASMNQGTFYYYNVLDTSPDEPHMYTTEKMEDLVTSRQLYAKIQSDHKNFKYKRLVLPNVKDPSVEWLDSLVDVMKEILTFDDKNAAVVFQGLTGEGPATLAAIFALLTTKSTSDHDKKFEKIYNRIRDVGKKMPWREYVINKMLTSSKLSGKPIRKEVDMAIAKCCAAEPLNTVSCDMGKHQGAWTLLGVDHSDRKPSVKGDASPKPGCPREESYGTINLRDISELSLNKRKNGKDHRERSKLIRREVCDEERLLRVLLFKVDLYYFLIVFRAYITEQQGFAFQRPFSQWLVHNPCLLFDISQVCSTFLRPKHGEKAWKLKRCTETDSTIALDPTYHRVIGAPVYGIAQTTKARFEKVVSKLCGLQARKNYRKVHFINVREEVSFYSRENDNALTTNGENGVDNSFGTRWELPQTSIPSMYGATADMIEEVEDRLKVVCQLKSDETSFANEDDETVSPPGNIQTTKDMIHEIAEKHSKTENCDEILYKRIPLPRHRIPRFQCFDELVKTMREHARDSEETAFVFFCHNGKRRTTNMMVASCLILSHMGKFDLDIENCNTNSMEPWAPDVEFTRGEYKVVLELIQILPDCHLRKKEVDVALDICHESMSTMHYHLREHLNPSYKKAKKATTIEEFLRLKHRSYLALEFYVFLIIFNTYLHVEKKDLWATQSFAEWMSQYATRLGVVDVLNNLGFVAFGEDYPMNLLRARWLDTSALCRSIQRETLSKAGIDMGEKLYADEDASFVTTQSL